MLKCLPSPLQVNRSGHDLDLWHDLWPPTLKTLSVHLPNVVSILASFGSYSFSSSRAIKFTRFLWPLLPDVDLWPHDLCHWCQEDMVLSNCDEFHWNVSRHIDIWYIYIYQRYKDSKTDSDWCTDTHMLYTDGQLGGWQKKRKIYFLHRGFLMIEAKNQQKSQKR